MALAHGQIAQRYRLFLCRLLEVGEDELDAEVWAGVIYEFARRHERMPLLSLRKLDAAILRSIAEQADTTDVFYSGG